MKNSKFLKRFVAIILTFITVLSFSSSTYALSVTPEEAAQLRKSLGQANPFELAITDLALGVGDFVMEYMTFLLKEEVTVQKLIYNQVEATNANFFKNSANYTKAPSSAIITEIVNNWYNALRSIAIVVYMVALVAVGIKILLGSAGQVAKAKEVFMKWTMGVAILFFFPYVMRYAFDINEAIISALSKGYGSSSAGSYLGDMSDLRSEEFELRSPDYITRSTYLLTLGSEEATQAYVENYKEYSEKGDMMRILRALAGITGRVMYVILWYIMLWQLLIFIYVYYKRYLIIAFLIAIFPITMLEYIIGTVSSGKQSALSSWSKEFFVNVFLQSIHAIIYTIISSVVINQITSLLDSGGVNKMNWMLMIVAISFVFTAEKMIRDIISAVTTTTNNPQDEANKTLGRVTAFGGGAVKKLFK